jgi:hypothetical protein
MRRHRPSPRRRTALCRSGSNVTITRPSTSEYSTKIMSSSVASPASRARITTWPRPISKRETGSTMFWSVRKASLRWRGVAYAPQPARL